MINYLVSNGMPGVKFSGYRMSYWNITVTHTCPLFALPSSVSHRGLCVLNVMATRRNQISYFGETDESI